MQSLLRWSIENSTPQDGAPSDARPTERKELDPAIIDIILGKADSELMKEDMAVALDATRSEDDRVNALDHLEMLIEQIDNANNLAKLNMWEPLQSLLTSDQSTPEIKTQALWVIGTALQNNPEAQDVYLSYQPLLTLISFLTPSPSSTLQTRSKAIYVLSGLLKHNAPAVEALGRPDVDGWSKLRDALQDPEISVRRKTIFLLNTLLIPTTHITRSAVPPHPQQDQLLIEDDPNPQSRSTALAAAAPSSGSSLHTPDQPTPEVIHDNSHAAHLRNPSRTSTSQLTLNAFRAHGILDAIISAVTTPVPYGEDGDNTEADADFEEKAASLLHTYVVTCKGVLSASQKQALKKWLEAAKSKENEAQLSEKWNLTVRELKALFSLVA